MSGFALILLILLILSIVNNVLMYNKCYLSNIDKKNPFLPENVNVMNIKFYYNKTPNNCTPGVVIENELMSALKPLTEKYKANTLLTVNEDGQSNSNLRDIYNIAFNSKC
jgi:hypothetical protein